MKITHPCLYAVKVTRDDGSSFMASVDGNPCCVWDNRRDAQHAKSSLLTMIGSSYRSMNVVKVKVTVSEIQPENK